MPSWEELEARFQALEGALQFSRLDAQWGAAGEHWRLAGSYDRDPQRRFEATAGLAGQKLRSAMPTDDEHAKKIADASDFVIAWYRALQHLGRMMKDRDVLEQTSDGKHAGFIFGGTIDRPAAASATLCLECASLYPDMAPPPSVPAVPIQISMAPQARININSVDSSSNAISSQTTILFQEMREAIRAGVPEPDREAILSRVNALEASAGSPSVLDRYKEFIAVLGNHVTVLSPFLAPLADLLASAR